MALRKLLRERGGPPLIMDGGMGTGLGRDGLSNQQCWTAGRNTDDEAIAAAVRAVHMRFLRAGADLLTANCYNVSTKRELYFVDPDAAAANEDRFIRANVALARSAIGTFNSEATAPFRGLVAAALGPYGSAILGRGETANRLVDDASDSAKREKGYGTTPEELEAFHLSRAVTALDAGVDVLAFETVPDLLEAEAIANVLTQLQTAGRRVEAYVMFTCREDESDGALIVDNGDPFEDCCRALAACAPCVALGVNCTDPWLVGGLLEQAKRAAPSKLLIAKPNSGEYYDMSAGSAEKWKADGGVGAAGSWKTQTGHDVATAHEYAQMALQWHAICGASLVGGCCRTGEEHTAAMRELCGECEPAEATP